MNIKAGRIGLVVVFHKQLSAHVRSYVTEKKNHNLENDSLVRYGAVSPHRRKPKFQRCLLPHLSDEAIRAPETSIYITKINGDIFKKAFIFILAAVKNL
jgi:hypothetical protein